MITGYEYTYDDLGRITTEKDLAKNIQICYTYDNLSRVTKSETTHFCCGSKTEENFEYDAAGNVNINNEFEYDQNNRLTHINGYTIAYDMDGNMLESYADNECEPYTYDSSNRLISAGNVSYVYNAEDVRIRKTVGEQVTEYVYDTSAKLSKLLVMTVVGVTTKFVYGLGLIGQESAGSFKTYHYDYRGSTSAITDSTGTVTDTFTYDTYGKLIGRTGTANTPFLYSGRDGVITDENGLYYMRARYYSPILCRFINADIVTGKISNAITLNRFAYANGNPVSNIDPFGLSAERGGLGPTPLEAAYMAQHIYSAKENTYSIIGDWIFAPEMLIKAGDGMVMGVYYREVDGITEYTLVNRGTVSWDLNKSDIYNNLLQPFGASLDMMASICYAQKFVEAHPDAHITFVGHSKGGGEALANAKATNKNAIVFNPAIPNYEKYGLDDNVYTANATSYVIEGEILSLAYSLAEVTALSPYTPMTPWLLDDFIALVSRPVFESKPFWNTEFLKNDGSTPIEAHSDFENMFKQLQ